MKPAAINSKAFDPRWSALAAVMWFASAGCSSPSSTGDDMSAPIVAKEPAAPDSVTRSLLSAEEKLDRLARREAETKTEARSSEPPTMVVKTPPPGIDPAALALRDEDDHRARFSLDEALTDVAGRTAAFDPLPEPAGPPDQELQTQALRHYARGRDHFTERRYTEAVTEFHRALQIDPDHPRILRELGRAYLTGGNRSRAIGIYERLIHVDPDDELALYVVGLASAERRNFELAAAVLSRPRLRGRSFGINAYAPVIASFTLAQCLDQLGYDQGFITLARSTLDQIESINMPLRNREIGSIYRQRADLRRAMGDASFRLGRFEAAREAYDQAMRVNGANRDSLLPRVIFASLNLDNEFSAQKALLDSIREEELVIRDRDILLCTYLLEHTDDVSLLSDALNELYALRPEHAGLARATASLLPVRQRLELLEDFIARRPRDLEVAQELLGWLGRQEVESALRLTVQLVRKHPDLAVVYARQLTHALPRPSLAITSVPADDDSAVRERVLIGVLQQTGAIGEAWNRCEAGLKRWPDDRLLQLCRVLLAAELDEPALVKQAIADAQQAGDIDYLLTAAAALSKVDEPRRAMALAREAVNLAPDDSRVITVYAQILAHHAEAQADPEDRAAGAEDAIEAAEEAIRLDPKNDEAYDVIDRLTNSSGLVADPSRNRLVFRRLEKAHPESRFLALYQVREDISRRRFEAALERLINLYEGDPTDPSSLALCVNVWTQLGRLQEAKQWIEGQLASRPGDPGLLEYWTSVQLLRGQSQKVIAYLRDDLDQHEGNRAARRLLEGAYRAAGDHAAVLELREPRLRGRPQGTRREADLATMYADAGRQREALTHLEWVGANTQDARQSHLLHSIETAQRLDALDVTERESLVADLTLNTLDRFPASSLGLYQIGLVSLARLDELDDRFDVLAARAVSDGIGALDSTRASILAWRDIAQALIDEGHHGAAARVLRARVSADPDFKEASTLDLAIRTITAEASVEGGATATIELVQLLAEHELLKNLVSLQGNNSVSLALYEFSQIYSIVGNHAGSDELLMKAIALDETFAMAMNNLGYTRIVAGRMDEQTVELLEEAYRLRPDDTNILDSVGWLRYKQGIFADEKRQPPQTGKTVLGANSLIQKAIAGSREPSPEVMDHLADTNWRRGAKDEALILWKKSVERYDDPARRSLIIERYRDVQLNQWGLLIEDPEAIYERQEGATLRRMREKIEAVEGGSEPSVAPTFEEMEQREAAGEN